ncbi:hypothetical protein HF521_017342 [Silurus meridionalis]|uniref:Ig-like domain-containing protein n=2 Tax=Silurus meridionalis TaxID=175797 RepID=A0A8T0BMZ1_SILME|nr:hypothetical protein HF521_017342 [Silurus meridionalis]
MNQEIEWKLNNQLLLSKAKTGLLRRGSFQTVSRARIDRTTLQIASLVSEDFGVYKCKTTEYKLFLASAQANPSTVLYNSGTKLSCDVATGSTPNKHTFQWFNPNSTSYSNDKEVNVKSVTTDNAGTWTCMVRDEKGLFRINVTVEVKVIGPLITSGEVMVSEWDTVELACLLSGKNRLPIKGGLWKREPPSEVYFPVLISTANTVKWNRTGVSDRVTFSDQELNANFSVKLNKVTRADTGVYVFTLEFEGGNSLSEKLHLTVLKREGFDSENDLKMNKNNIWHKSFWGMQMWIWVAIVLSIVVLISLVIIIVVIYRRNKRMKRRMNKLNSMRQPRDYCKCTRGVGKPRAGKKARPPPLSRHDYSSLHDL